jgi:hypothetical protein
MSNKLTIQSEMAALDSKDREFYDSLTDEEKKKFSVFLMLRYGSAVRGSSDMQQYYLAACNKRLNKDFFNIPKGHEKLKWLVTTTISPGVGNQFHEWIAPKKKDAGSNNKVSKFLQKIFPNAKAADLDLLIDLNDAKVWKQYAKDLGWSPEQIKKELG